MMLCEQPQYRRALLKYTFEGLRGVPRKWRDSIGQAPPIVVPRWRLLLAWLCGPFLYARERFGPRNPLATRLLAPSPVERSAARKHEAE